MSHGIKGTFKSQAQEPASALRHCTRCGAPFAAEEDDGDLCVKCCADPSPTKTAAGAAYSELKKQRDTLQDMLLQATKQCDELKAKLGADEDVRELLENERKLSAEFRRRLETSERMLKESEVNLAEARAERDAMKKRLRECLTSPPSDGHDEVDEVLGLLRVSRQQRDDAEDQWGVAQQSLKAAHAREAVLREAIKKALNALAQLGMSANHPFILELNSAIQSDAGSISYSCKQLEHRFCNTPCDCDCHKGDRKPDAGSDFVPRAELEKAQKQAAAYLMELQFWTGAKHEGACEFSDKSDEGCWLCAKAERERWPQTKSILEQPDAGSDRSDEVKTP